MIKFNSALSGLTLSFRILHPFLLLRLLQLNLIFVLKCFHLILGWNCHDVVLRYILMEVNYYKILNIQIHLKYKLANFSNKPVCIFCHYLKKKKRKRKEESDKVLQRVIEKRIWEFRGGSYNQDKRKGQSP